MDPAKEVRLLIGLHPELARRYDESKRTVQLLNGQTVASARSIWMARRELYGSQQNQAAIEFSDRVLELFQRWEPRFRWAITSMVMEDRSEFLITDLDRSEILLHFSGFEILRP